MRWVPVGPADRLRSFVVVLDVTANLAGQVGDGGKDAACEELPLDLGKPELDLIQPRRVGRREMDRDVRMREQEGPDGLGLVGRQIVGNHVNLTPSRLTGDDVAEEVDKRGARVAWHRL